MMNIYDKINVPFGIRCENNKLLIGNTSIDLSAMNDKNAEKKYVFTLLDKQYNLTPGLRELLMRSKPNFNLITEEDKSVYKDILDITNVHKRDYDPKGQIKGDKGIKYRRIIKPLFTQKARLTASKLKKKYRWLLSTTIQKLQKKYRLCILG